jgi:hypothetical protein
LEEEYEKRGFKISDGKAEYLGTDHSEELQINGNTLPTVKQFKYLGSIIQENGSSGVEIKKRVVQQNSVLWNRNIFTLNKVINIQINSKKYINIWS